jgi:hypothetical protein
MTRISRNSGNSRSRTNRPRPFPSEDDPPWLIARLAVLLARAAALKAERRVKCLAKTRKGTACRHKSEPGKRRCKFHGGLSTGPRTAEGRERIAEAQRRRWARWRAERAKG